MSRDALGKFFGVAICIDSVLTWKLKNSELGMKFKVLAKRYGGVLYEALGVESILRKVGKNLVNIYHESQTLISHSLVPL
jgi:hypothetical protein